MCKFCDEVGRFYRQFNSGHPHGHSVAIMARVFIEGCNGKQGRSMYYWFRDTGYKLNFCPECGAKMVGGTDHENV